MEFDQILTGLWGTDERFIFWGQIVKVQGHGGVKYAQNALFGIVVVTYWRNHNSQRSSNYHLVLVYFRTRYDVLTCMMTLIRRLGGAGVKKNSLELLTLVSGRHCITAG